ncbi:MAG: exosortase/archaeosortase family protein [Desulfobulbaceae bacterium]|nr:exosortase/archaeosortase family protein [Desulfobulbaceae bacterium]
MTGEKTKPFQSIFLAGLLFSIVAAYHPVLLQLVKTWARSGNHSHGFFIIPISFYIIWQKKDQLSAIEIKPSWVGGALILISLGVYFLAYHAGVHTVCSLTIISLAAGIALFLFGWKMARALCFPLFLLLFMIPVPSQIYASITVPLQLIVSKISVYFASAIGIPIMAEGNVIQLPGKTLEIVEACSGLRSLVSLLTLSLVFGYFTLQANVSRTILFLSAVPIAIIVNIFRVLAILSAFYFYDFDLAGGSIHTWLGLAVFLLALSILSIEKGIIGIWDR